MELRIDADANAGYVSIRSQAAVARTERFSDSVLIDVAPDGAPVGIELLTLTATVDTDGIANRYGLSAVVRDELRRTFSGESA